MSEELRNFIYPLGFLSSFAFGLRFIVQWIQSEIHQRSVVHRSFWILSLIGNVLLFLHAFFQIQFHICVIQGCNVVISWRNLNLMQKPEKQAQLFNVFTLLAGVILLTTSLFAFQGIFIEDNLEWFRIPVSSWELEDRNSISSIWHAFGFFGFALFSSRFWIQWWGAEKHRTSYLGSSFWWISLAGTFFSLAYFIRIHDLVNILGPIMGIIPYVRNLMLIRKSRTPAYEKQ